MTTTYKPWTIRQEREWRGMLLKACTGKLSPKKAKRMDYLQQWRDGTYGP